MALTLLATKLHRPWPAAGLLARARLTQRLDAGLRNDHRLFLVVAPAGYGKTTLITDWLGKTGNPCAWLSVDEADNDPHRFFSYIVAALQTLGLDVGQPFLDAFPALPQSPEALVHPLINEVAAANRPIILALDDYHLITNTLIQDAMAFLLEHAPPNLRLVVLTRADPPFSLPRLRVRELMTEVRDRDLRFTPEEMAAFLNIFHRLSLPADQIAALEARTEGWPAGVQLAALSLQGSSAEQAAQFIAAFSGSHHYIMDYLFDEVLRRQPDDVRGFLLQTSILDRMCAPLCEGVLYRGAEEQGGKGAGAASPSLPTALSPLPPFSLPQAILEHLEHSHLFLIPLDDERRWYRYHPLFMDALRQLLGASFQPAQIAGLHRRASGWFRQNGFVAEAVHHALRAGDHRWAAQVVEENAWAMVRHGELATLEQWLLALPDDAIAAHPWLRIYYAWALLFQDARAAEGQLQAVEHRPQARDRTTLPAEMQGHITAIRAWIAYLNGDADRAVLLSRQALEDYPQMDAAVSSGLVAITGEGCLLRNDFPGGLRAYAEAAELARSSGNIMLEVAARTSLGDVTEWMGRLREAEAIYQEALRKSLQHKSPAAAQAYLCLAGVHREWNELASAKFFAERTIESSRMWGVADTLACGYITLADILQAQHDVAGANRALAEANQIINEHPHEVRSVRWIGAVRARLWLAQGKLDDARRWAESRELNAETEPDLRHEVELLALVRILLAEGRLDRALHLVARLQTAIESTGRQGSLIEALVLRAVALEAQANKPSALLTLAQALSLARPEGYVRVFLDEGKPMERLLKAAITQWKDQDLLAYARKLLAAFNDDIEPTPSAQPPHPGILSERELEVLRLMAAGRSNQEIADALVIAIGTAKRHTANIFDRLDVRNRTEAVAKARQLRLL